MRDGKRSKEPSAKLKGKSEGPLKRPLLVPVFSYADYRVYLTDVIDANTDWRGFRKTLAEAAGCTPSFLAQVLSDSGSFSFDHMHGIAQFLGISADEWTFLRELLVAEKCSTPSTRADALNRAEAIKERHGAGVMHATPALPVAVGGMREVMFSLLHWDVFHILGSPKHGTPEQLAEKFGVTRERIVSVLMDWERSGFVERSEEGIWRCSAVRFKSEAVVRSSISAMYRMRSLTRAFEGKAPTPRFACVRLRKNQIAVLSAKVDEIFEEAWQLAAASQADGDQAVFLSVDLDAL